MTARTKLPLAMQHPFLISTAIKIKYNVMIRTVSGINMQS